MSAIKAAHGGRYQIFRHFFPSCAQAAVFTTLEAAPALFNRFLLQKEESHAAEVSE